MSMDHWWHRTDKGKPKYSQKMMSQYHFAHHKAHTDWPGTELVPPRWVARQPSAWAV